MIKKVFMLLLVLTFLATPSFAILRILDDGLSTELRGIAKQEIHVLRNIPLAELSTDTAWLREYFSIDRSVYMVTVVHRDTSFEVPVDVAGKKVLSEADLKSLDEEDRAKSSQGEPVARTFMAAETVEYPPSERALLQEVSLTLTTIAMAAPFILLGAKLGLSRARESLESGVYARMYKLGEYAEKPPE